MDLTILWYVAASVLIAVGLTGTVLPILPGVGIATWIGLLFGTVAKLALSLPMLGVFVLALII